MAMLGHVQCLGLSSRPDPLSGQPSVMQPTETTIITPRPPPFRKDSINIYQWEGDLFLLQSVGCEWDSADNHQCLRVALSSTCTCGKPEGQGREVTWNVKR